MICNKRLNVNDVVALEEVRRIYELSFPIDERREFASLVELLKSKRNFSLEAICRGDDVIGMLTSWQLNEWRYIEHFAIDASMRGQGVGRSVLKTFLMQQSSPVVLEVEPPVDDWSVRRVAFYRSLGFELHSNYKYVQPPYGEGLKAIELCLMTYRAPLDCDMDTPAHLLYKQVYGVDCSD